MTERTIEDAIADAMAEAHGEEERALEVVDRLTGEVVDVREAAPEELGAFCENAAQLRGELADAEAVVSAELVRRLDRRGEWTWRVGDPKADVQYEIKAPSPTAGTTTVDRDRLRDELRRLLEEDAIEPELAEAALKRTVTIVATVPTDADLEELAKRLGSLEAIAGVQVRAVKVDTSEAADVAGVNRLKKAGHAEVVDDITVATTPPSRKAKVTPKRRDAVRGAA